jgi:hypothetical protein
MGAVAPVFLILDRRRPADLPYLCHQLFFFSFVARLRQPCAQLPDLVLAVPASFDFALSLDCHIYLLKKNVSSIL